MATLLLPGPHSGKGFRDVERFRKSMADTTDTTHIMNIAKHLSRSTVDMRSFADLPEEVVYQIQNAAKEVFRWKLRLRLILKTMMTKRSLQSAKIKERPTPAALAESPLFKDWPADTLRLLIQRATPQAYDSDEYIFYRGEHATSGIVIITSGEVDLVRVGKPAEQRTAPTMFGDLIQISNEDHTYSVLTTTPCSAWVVRHKILIDQFERFDEETQYAVKASLLAALCRSMAVELPVSVGMLRSSSKVFQDASDNELSELLSNLSPAVVFKGANIYNQGDPSNCCYILRKGTVRSQLSVSGGVVEHILQPPNTLGELDMLFREKRRAAMTAVTQCYFYKVHLVDLSARPSLLEGVSRAATNHRKQGMDSDIVVNYMSKCLLFASLPGKVLTEISRLFCPKILSPTELVASRSEHVTHMFVITRGHAIVGNLDTYRYPGEAHITVGETVGYTGLVKQRWLFPLYAGELLECWMLCFGELESYLRKKKLYNSLLQRSKDLYEKQMAGVHNGWRRAPLSEWAPPIAKYVPADSQPIEADREPLQKKPLSELLHNNADPPVIKGYKNILPLSCCRYKRRVRVRRPDPPIVKCPARRPRTAAPTVADKFRQVSNGAWEGFSAWSKWKREIYAKEPDGLD